ncbi:PP2C family protein-serine/threonine phosphatase [Neotabrizicola sp. sgz301269]|uniref:PP2C family protein-serine/threonine phosphatase n=1 Tax=Neotabrizicola sp. sgz301269 TaxID=3276282 RepID=UPI00376FA841
MTFLSKLIQQWSSRQKPAHSYASLQDFPVSLGSHIGAVRDENQDRILAGTLWRNDPRDTAFVTVLCDGMGGMLEGALAASIASSSFLEAALHSVVLDTHRRLSDACQYANRKVSESLNAKGGSTLTAIFIDSEQRVWVCNIGDSRSYGVLNTSEVIRLTKDDSLAEIVGGERRDLLQFVGMGSGMVPTITEVDSGVRRIILTSDGAHFFNSDVFSEIITNAKDPETCVRRVTALSQWLGGPDNSTVGCIDTARMREILHNRTANLEGCVQVWDESSTCYFSSTERDRNSIQPQRHSGNREPSPENQGGSRTMRSDKSTPQRPEKRERQSKRKQSDSKKREIPEQIELKIEVENGGNESSK